MPKVLGDCWVVLESGSYYTRAAAQKWVLLNLISCWCFVLGMAAVQILDNFKDPFQFPNQGLPNSDQVLRKLYAMTSAQLLLFGLMLLGAAAFAFICGAVVAFLSVILLPLGAAAVFVRSCLVAVDATSFRLVDNEQRTLVVGVV